MDGFRDIAEVGCDVVLEAVPRNEAKQRPEPGDLCDIIFRSGGLQRASHESAASRG